MKIVLAVKDEESATPVAALVLNHLLSRKSSLCVLHVIRPIQSYVALSVIPELIDELRKEELIAASKVVQNIASRMLDSIEDLDIEEIVREGDPATEVIKQARSMNADLIVLGTHTLSSVEKVFGGSVASAIAAKAECSVFVARPPLAEERA